MWLVLRSFRTRIVTPSAVYTPETQCVVVHTTFCCLQCGIGRTQPGCSTYESINSCNWWVAGGCQKDLSLAIFPGLAAGGKLTTVHPPTLLITHTANPALLGSSSTKAARLALRYVFAVKHACFCHQAPAPGTPSVPICPSLPDSAAWAERLLSAGFIFAADACGRLGVRAWVRCPIASNLWDGPPQAAS